MHMYDIHDTTYGEFTYITRIFAARIESAVKELKEILSETPLEVVKDEYTRGIWYVSTSNNNYQITLVQ